jgi:hypothetical protein
MGISIYFGSKTDLPELVIEMLKDTYDLERRLCDQLYYTKAHRHFSPLKDNIYFSGETYYTDSFYRDSYYHYFSSKLKSYDRDCIRISLFEDQVNEEDFNDQNKHDDLFNRYRGFYIIRPTFPNIIGRSIISPKALKNQKIRVCSSTFNTTVNSLKFSVNGFPHASQDREVITCAETSLWAIMEYFGNKYPQYKPVNSSTIIDHLNSISIERQIPSDGLTSPQISYALMKCGFGTKIYSHRDYGDEFFRLLSCYIESGIPLIIGIDNEPDGKIGHAVLAIGRETISSYQYNNIGKYILGINTLNEKATQKNIEIFDYDSIPKNFVFIDDSQPAYHIATLSEPTKYHGEEWINCKIKYFVVPLHPRVYLDAAHAKNHIITFLLCSPQPIHNDSKVVLRVFLASSRSYKHELSRNRGVGGLLKDLLIATQMPKFIWVAEISTKELIMEEKSNGLLILDATEANIDNSPLIIAAYNGNLLQFEKSSGNFNSSELPLDSFQIFSHNLRPTDTW